MEKSTYDALFRTAFLIAARYKPSHLNAEMVAISAIEDVWADPGAPADWAEFNIAVARRAKYLARNEMYGDARQSQFVDEPDYDEGAKGTKSPALREDMDERLDLTARLDDVRRASSELDEPAQQIMFLLLRGYGSVDISKELQRPVPIIVAEIKRIREALCRVRSESI